MRETTYKGKAMYKILVAVLLISLPTGLSANKSIQPGDLTNDTRAEQDSLQVTVPSQFQMVNGGASCGYQALFNGLKISDLITKSGAAWLEAKNDIGLLEKRNELFGACTTPWRQFIIDNRKKAAFIERLTEEILRQWTENLSTDGKAVLRDQVTRISRKLVGDLYKREKGVLNVDAETIKNDLLEEINKTLQTATTAINQIQLPHLHEELTTNRFGKFNDIALQTPSELGNWLEPHELYNLIEQFNLNDQRLIFCVGGSINGSMPLTEDIELQTNPDFQRFQKEFQSESGTTSAVFLLYTGGRTAHDTRKADKNYYAAATSGCTHGHWYTVVANKVGAERQYILADSLNPDRLHHERFRELKALLEGYEYVQAPSGKGDIPYTLGAHSIFLPTRSSKESSFLNSTNVGFGLIITVIVGTMAYRSYQKHQQYVLYRSKSLTADDSVATAA